MSRRSTIELLPPEIRAAVDAAIEDGATIDVIAAVIRARGAVCSRSSVARYVRRMREQIRRQREIDRAAKTWATAIVESAEDGTRPVALEAVGAAAAMTVATLDGDRVPVAPIEIARLALALLRIEGAGKLLAEGARTCTCRSGHKGRVSVETVAAIRPEVEGELAS